MSQTHNFCDDATDWFAFTAQAHSIYAITTSSWGQRADTFLALFDTDSHTLLVGNDDYEGTTDYSSRIVWQAPADGTYYARITNRADLFGCDTDYGVWIERQTLFHLYLPIVLQDFGASAATAQETTHYPTGIINHVCRDAYEIDDTWQQAHSIEVGVTQIHSFDSDPSNFAADKDFVGIDAWVGRPLTFTIAPITNTQTLLELYDEKGVALGLTGTTELAWTPAASGRYYLSVSPLTTTFGCSSTVGYGLLMGESPQSEVYLPLVIKSPEGG
jgi:hypothetical protein